MITFYHNPRCGTSRNALALVQASGEAFELVEYLQSPLTPNALKALAVKVGDLRAMTRKTESLYTELGLEEASDSELLKAMATHPILMQRPILVKGNKAVVARPPERWVEVL